MVEQKKSSRRIRFERVAARRVTNILEQLRLLGQLANPVTYTYGEEDAEKILDALDLAVAQVHEVFRTGQGRRKRPFRLKDLPNYILMELWMIWNMVPYLWYRLVVVRFDLK